MHVVIVSDHETQGGAAIAGSRLSAGLHRAGHRVTRLVYAKDGQSHDWDTYDLTASDTNRFGQRLAHRLLPSTQLAKLNQRIDMQASKKRLEQFLDELRPDVINVHNLHGSKLVEGPLEVLDICARQAPTVWTLHDMWSFTGRCAYNYECRKFLTGCDEDCPTPDEYPILGANRIASAWKERRQLLSRHPTLVAVCPSRWLAEEATAGAWKNHLVRIIPYGLPLDVYQPVDRSLARQALGIETSGPVFLASAVDFAERRKGGEILANALPLVSTRPFTLMIMGSGNLSIKIDDMHFVSLGYVSHERMKVLAYSAADLFVHPAPVDNLPNVVMEAIACGTPVVGFSIGGVPDMVRPGVTGWLANEVSHTALATALNRALDDLHNGIDLRASCRATAVSEYGGDVQASQYSEVFATLLQNKATAVAASNR